MVLIHSPGPACVHKNTFFNGAGRNTRGTVGLVSTLYRMARIANDVRVLSSENPKRIARHYANKALGRCVLNRMYLRKGIRQAIRTP